MGEYQESYVLRSSRGCIPVRGKRITKKMDLMRYLFVPTMTLGASSFQQKYKEKIRIIVNDSNEVFYLGEYVIDYSGSIRVCSNIQFVTPVAKSISEILDILTNILNAISILCIILLLVIYLKVPALHTVPGLNVMSTSFSLMCMQIMYTLANVLEKGTLFCQISGNLLHYFWLSLCCCLFICCLHMFLSFRGIRIRNTENSRRVIIRKEYVKYILFCYMLPVTIISLNVILSYVINCSIGYGKRICFVENFVQNIVTFIVPLLLTCVSNLFLFVLIIINIDVDKNIQKSKDNKSELVIFIKLFCLTGSVWILQVIDSFLELSFFSLVVTLLTSSQGIFIFLIFSSSSHIRNMLKCK
ncbi:LOW QUALITY PROTEIN: probable G-protein coupled receptor Mth-like 3 [Saccostrea cucullata]|uniref:LOW QUALITY PROTEIN: probable G-protein coupled receptor Mth-like 3 n=1 Tax=Saccostrea cuccullata TaxID=36930 RepID=UPI002ED3FFFC